MENLINLSQIIVAISVVYVWTFRFHNVLKEDGIPIRLEVNENIAIDPNDDKNPKTEIEIFSRW
ncbi:hypothetical protein [Urechidicola vernalis]|uniref:Uncharacterized protein n=1 Tax=Urechidicola vernalis TaxID=3075600 RepID=A0ABU2Y7D9_9FLAO|nr:hypothetical protein [Urechidicola sp. P050]MDT0554124.1 hypothetical protein [Urechidicola sp. P050]